jgi:hypothetical protein
MTKEELIEATYSIAGGKVSDLTYEQLTHLMTITQFVTDLCSEKLNIAESWLGRRELAARWFR